VERSGRQGKTALSEERGFTRGSLQSSSSGKVHRENSHGGKEELVNIRAPRGGKRSYPLSAKKRKAQI